jgi:hypothetical protein
MDDLFPPRELINKCFALIKSTHDRIGYRDLAQRIATKRDMVSLAMTPRMLGMVGSIATLGKLRVIAWAAIVVSSLLGLFISRTWWLVTLVVIVTERLIARKEREQLLFLSAILLALEMLAGDFAGWGSALPVARNQAMKILGCKGEGVPSGWLDFYLPRRASLDRTLLTSFGPGDAMDNTA